jgi:transaldolase/glucose-6-phosphate isomerase
MVDVAKKITEIGQSLWLDYISRDLLNSGKLDRLVGAGIITGITSNPSIFEKAISGSSDYEVDLQRILASDEADPYDAFVQLAVEDIRNACDVLLPVYKTTAAVDGFVSLEVPPGIENNVQKTVTEAKRLFNLVDRPNVMIKVPGTNAGVQSLTELIAVGVNVNVTLLFSITMYKKVAHAYIAGLEQLLEKGEDLSQIASVASFFVSRLDTAVDEILDGDSPLRGTAAIANARSAYGNFEEIFSGQRWGKLVNQGARVQRPLWASTSTKNPQYRDTLYFEELLAPNTVNTLPEPTLDAILDHGNVQLPTRNVWDSGHSDLAMLSSAGVDLEDVTKKLLEDGLASFEKDFLKLLEQLHSRIKFSPSRYVVQDSVFGSLEKRVDEQIAVLEKNNIVHRIWEEDYTLWSSEKTEVSNRLGWLNSPGEVVKNAPSYLSLRKKLLSEGFTDFILIGMGGAVLAPEVLARIQEGEGLKLHLLDTTNPDEINALVSSLDLETTFFIISSKSGSTLETSTLCSYFWEKVSDSRKFIAITDHGTELEKFARAHRFRHIELGIATVGGRFSAISPFGMLPASLCGLDPTQIALRADEMFSACRATDINTNPGAYLGVVLGVAARSGREKLVLSFPSEMQPFASWVEQMIAESTGKEGLGIVPVIAPSFNQGSDCIFVSYNDSVGITESEDEVVVHLPYIDPSQIGAEFARWEFATAVAAHILGIQPFDQKNVQEAKDATLRVLSGTTTDMKGIGINELLQNIEPSYYIALLCWLPRTKELEDQLAVIQHAFIERYGIAVTIGFGPRYLHSTGQLHKGGSDNTLFIFIEQVNQNDIAIEGKSFSFNDLNKAQAQGDVESLSDRKRLIARVTLSELTSFLDE